MPPAPPSPPLPPRPARSLDTNWCVPKEKKNIETRAKVVRPLRVCVNRSINRRMDESRRGRGSRGRGAVPLFTESRQSQTIVPRAACGRHLISIDRADTHNLGNGGQSCEVQRHTPARSEGRHPPCVNRGRE
eukprot:1088687-Prymnesium_polylepis.1